MKKGPGYRMMVYLSKHMIACDEASFLISLHEDHQLGFRKWWQLRMHLLTCHLCRKYAHQIKELSRAFEVYRHSCNQEKCTHHLSHEAGSRINKELIRELRTR